jgi:hypothetical protein
MSERPAVDARREHQPRPEIPEVVGQHAQLEAHFVGPEPMTGLFNDHHQVDVGDTVAGRKRGSRVGPMTAFVIATAFGPSRWRGGRYA